MASSKLLQNDEEQTKSVETLVKEFKIQQEKDREEHKNQIKEMMEIHKTQVKDVIKRHEAALNEIQLEMKKLREDHKKEIADLKRQHEENGNSRPLKEIVLKRFAGLSSAKKALVILVLVAVSACCIWASYTFIMWALPYVMSFVNSCYAYLATSLQTGIEYLMSLPWFSKACCDIPSFCMENSDAIIDAAALGGGIWAIVVMFIKHTNQQA